MLKLRGGTVTDAANDEIFRELFLQKLPLTVRTALTVHKDASFSVLADMADNMAEVQGPQAPVYQLQHQGDSEITAIKTELQKIWKTSSRLHQGVNNHSLASNLIFVGAMSNLV